MITISIEEWRKLSIEEQYSFVGIVKKHNYTIYLRNGKWHRLDGPAFISSNGNGIYYINGKEYTKEDYNKHPEVIMYKIENSTEFQDVLKYKNL